jgi:2-isopropylmalate synthase
MEADVAKAGEALAKAGHSRIHTFIATSDIHLEYKLKKTRSEVLEMTRRAVKQASSLANEVEFSAEDATRTDIDFLCEILDAAVDSGATVLNIPDTVGYMLPNEYAAVIASVKERVVRDRDVTISVHCHNDLGLAVAGTLAALEAGARQVECTINGIGERAGNAALEEVIMAVNVRAEKLPYAHNIDATLLYPTSQLLSSFISFGVQPNKAIVGRNAFAHEAGIHQHGMLSNPLCYEIMTPESVGVRQSDIVLGKHSGRHALESRLQSLGYSLDSAALGEIYKRFSALADKKKNIYDQDLLALIPQSSPAAIAA